jgi:hypothetical protein
VHLPAYLGIHLNCLYISLQESCSLRLKIKDVTVKYEEKNTKITDILLIIMLCPAIPVLAKFNQVATWNF